MPAIGVLASNELEASRYLQTMLVRDAVYRVITPETYVPSESPIDSLDGLLLTGGPDINPTTSSATSTRHTGAWYYPQRDEWEALLLREALDRDMPVMGICRGMHVINLTLGGQIIPDIDGHVLEKDISNKSNSYHQVYISPGSKIAAILGSGGFVRVNSHHRQGLKEPQKATSLVASVYSLEDGLIEAIESPNHDWIIGVQWQNELEEDLPRNFGNLFQGLIERSSAYADKKQLQNNNRNATNRQPR